MKSIEYLENAIRVEPRVMEADVDLNAVMDNCDTAYISGSIVEGFGNSASDVDIYVLTDKNPLLPEGIKFGYTNNLKGYYNEVIVYHYDYVREMCELINTEKYDIEAYNFLEQMEFYYRCAIGVPLVNDSKFYALTEDFSKENANKAYAKYYHKKCILALETMNGLLKLKMDEIAYTFAQKAAKYALDFWLACNGEGYESDKFRFLKVRRVCGDDNDMYMNFWKLQSKGTDGISTYISKVISSCKSLGFSEADTYIKDITYVPTGSIVNMELVYDFIIFKGNYVYKVSDIHKFILEKISEGIVIHNDLILAYEKEFDSVGHEIFLLAIRDLCEYGIITIS